MCFQVKSTIPVRNTIDRRSQPPRLSQSRETWRKTLIEHALRLHSGHALSLSKGLSKPSFPPFSVSIRPLRGLLNQQKAFLSPDFEIALSQPRVGQCIPPADQEIPQGVCEQGGFVTCRWCTDPTALSGVFPIPGAVEKRLSGHAPFPGRLDFFQEQKAVRSAEGGQLLDDRPHTR